MFFARIVAPVALIEWLVYTSDNLHFLLKLVMKVPSIFFLPVARCNTNCHQNHRIRLLVVAIIGHMKGVIYLYTFRKI